MKCGIYGTYGKKFPGVPELTIDHINPVCLGGNNRQENLRTMCKKCHTQRHKEEGHGRTLSKTG